MAEKPRFLDVWIVETNTVYREVPFTVVADWVQQGRVLENDMLRWSGQKDWFAVGATPSFAAYLPHADPHRANDQAEALEAVRVDFSWKPRDDEDDDVDMIPLIDVSLVLLIFFIMTTTAVAVSTNIQTPTAEFGFFSSDPDILWIGIDRDGKGDPVYSIGFGDKPATAAEDQNIATLDLLLDRMDNRMAEKQGNVDINIKGNEQLPAGVIRDLAIKLEGHRMIKGQLKIGHIYAGVREKNP
jgi:biopolymer transport protein ExbD